MELLFLNVVVVESCLDGCSKLVKVLVSLLNAGPDNPYEVHVREYSKSVNFDLEGSFLHSF